MELIRRLPPQGAPARAPILFVHGAWHGAWCWEPHFLPWFAAHGHPAYALSLRGHAGSPSGAPLRKARLRDYVDDVAGAAREIGGAPVLVGHSMGGFIVQHYLGRHPAAAAVLLASVPPGGALGISLRTAARHPLVFAEVNLRRSLFPVVRRPGRARRLLVSDRLPADAWAGYQRRLGDESYGAYLDMVVRDLPRVQRGAAPVLVLGAADDGLISHAEVRATARAWDAECEIVPGISHDVMLDPGWRDAADRILAWLAATLAPAHAAG